MNIRFVKMVSKILREFADKLDAGTTDITEDQALDILSTLMHEPLSKEQACSYLNMSRSKFDDLVKHNILPHGRKRRGFKELVWYKDELNINVK